jgi:hypothetical protein
MEPGNRFRGIDWPAYVAWRAGTTKSVVIPARQAWNRFLGSLKCLQLRAQGKREREPGANGGRAGIFKKSMGARKRGGIGLSYWPDRLHRLAEFIPWNQCRGPINI